MSKETNAIVALKSLMSNYQLNPYSLAKSIKLSQSGVRQIVIGKTRISAEVALRLAKFFGNTPEFWLNLQQKTDLADAAKSAKFQALLRTIPRAKKPDPAAAKAGAKGRKPGAKGASAARGRKPAAKGKAAAKGRKPAARARKPAAPKPAAAPKPPLIPAL